MFERFTEKARRVLVLAQEEAQGLGHNFIGTEHLVLGLVAEGQGVGAKVLTSFGVSLPDVREHVLKLIGDVTTQPKNKTKKPPFTARAKKVLELPLREALHLGHNYIGTEHLLLGLIREGEGVGAEALIALGINLGDVRSRVLEMLQGYSPAPPPVLSPALTDAMAGAGKLADAHPVTTGHLLLAILDDDASLGAKAMAALHVTRSEVEATLAGIALGATSDGGPGPQTVEIKLGDVSTEIADPALASALLHVEPEEIAAALREVIQRRRPPDDQ